MYYSGLNDALDLYAVRIPTTNSNMGTLGRIVAFCNDAENIIYTSPYKNALDDSDYDGDAMNVLYNPIIEHGLYNTNEDGKIQKLFFDAISRYYYNKDNRNSILSTLSTDSLVTYADGLDAAKGKKASFIASNLGVTVENDRIMYDGNVMVGHFANLNNILTTLFTIPLETRKILFPNSNLLSGEVAVEETFNFITKLIQAATVNAGLGGVLGRLNVNKYTSPLISGMIYEGLTKEEVDGGVTLEKKLLDVLTSDDVLTATKKVISTNKAGIQYPIKLINTLVNIPELRKYTAMGEQVRRAGDFMSIEKDLGSSVFDIHKEIDNMQKDLGMDINDFMSKSSVFKEDPSTAPSIAEQFSYYKKVYYSSVEKAGKKANMEDAIRNTFNMAAVIPWLDRSKSYIRMLRSADDVIMRSFLIDKHISDVIAKVEEYTGKNELFNESEWNPVEADFNKYLEGLFIEEESVDIDSDFITKNKINKTTFDGSLISDRVMVVLMGPKYLNYLRGLEKYSGNAFLNVITKSSNKGRDVIELPNSMHIDENRRKLMSIDFDMLDENHKQFFRFYSAIVYGFDVRNGSFSPAMDNEMEKRYSTFLYNLDINNELDADKIAVDIIRNNGMLARYVEYRKMNDAKQRFIRVTKDRRKTMILFEKSGNSRKIATNPYPSHVNPFFSESIFSNINTGVDLSLGELIDLHNDGSVQIHRNNGVGIYDNPKTEFHVGSGGTVRILDGTDVIVYKRGFYSAIYKEKKKTSKIGNRQRIIGSDIINGLMYFIKKAFPNLEFIMTRSDDPSNPNRDDIAYIYNGKVYFNSDKIQKDTPVHELSHVITMILKYIGSPIYLQLRDQAIAIINNNGEDYKKIKEHYGYLSEEDMIDEVIGNIAGWTSEDAMTMFLNNMKIDNNVWDNVKDIIKRLWDDIKGILRAIIGLKPNVLIDIDMGVSTIEGLASYIVDALKSGKVISPVSSDTLLKLQNGKLMRSSISGVIKNINDIKNRFFAGFEDPEERKKREIQRIKDLIHNNDMTAPSWLTGSDNIVFEEFDSVESKKKLEDIYIQYKNYKRKFINDVVTFLNKPGGATMHDSISFYENEDGEQKPRYTESTMDRFLRSIDYDKNTRYFKYSDLKDHEKYGFMFDEAFVSEDFDPIIAIEYDVKTGVKVSVFDVSNSSLGYEDITAVKGNLFRNVITDNEALRRGISLKNKELDLHKFIMGLLITKLNNLEKVTINNMSIIELKSGRDGTATPHQIDMLGMNTELLNIVKTKEVMNEFDGSEFMLLLNPKKIKYVPQDYLKSLQEFYRTHGDVKIRGISTSTQITQHEMIEILNKRLRLIEGNVTTDNIGNMSYSNTQMQEIKLIRNLIYQLRSVPFLDNAMNPYMNIDDMRLYASDTGSIGNENVQRTRQLILDVSNKVVNDYMNVTKPLKSKGGVFDKLRDRAGVNFLRERSLNVSEQIFKDLFVFDKDINGKDFRTGFIYYSNDPAVDPINGQKAKDNNVSQEVLDAGKVIVDIIEEMLIQTLVTRRNNERTGFLKSDDKKRYTVDAAKRELFDNDSGYKRGMIPLLPQSTGEKFAKGKVWDGMKSRFNELTDVYSLLSEATRIDISESKDLNMMRDMFFWQFSIGKGLNKEKYGNISRSKGLLGITMHPMSDGNVGYSLDNEKMNRDLSYDLELIMNYFVMSTIRNNEFEDNVLPVLNASRIIALDNKLNKGINTDGEMQFYEDYYTMTVLGARKRITGSIGPVKVDTLLAVAGTVTTPLVMAFNLNVPLISLVTNGMYSFVEGITTSIAKGAGITDRGFPTAKSLLKATGMICTPDGFKKITQLANQLQLINANDYELINMQRYQKTKKSIFTRFYMNWGNWASDFFARSIVMAARMMDDGSYDAYTYNKESGTVSYDPKKDDRMGWDGRGYSDEGKVRMRWLEQQSVSDGVDYGLGYSIKEARTFKALADKYIIGAYDNKTRSLWANYMIGKMFLMFKNWMVTRYQNALSERKYLEEGGKLVIVRDENGELGARWERIMTEGYMTTVFEYIRDSVLDKRMIKWGELDDVKKYNIIKASVNLAAYTMMFAAYNLLVSDKDDDDKPIPDWRIIRNFKYAYQSLLILPMIIEAIEKPFATVSILTSFWNNPFGEASIEKLPIVRQAMTVVEPFQE